MTGTKIVFCGAINVPDLFLLFAIHIWYGHLKVSEGIYGPVSPLLIISV